jgi:Tol biopolymer transport system component
VHPRVGARGSRSMFRVWRAVACSGVFALILVQAAAPASPPMIAFQSNRDGSYQVYVLNPETGAETARTSKSKNQGQNFDPAWEPGGRRIVFESDRAKTTTSEIYVMNASGTSPQRWTSNQVADRNPAWSPDGATIAFQSNGSGNYEIYRMPAKRGGKPTQLTRSAAEDSGPAWSPDGTKIAFETNRDGNFEIYVMNAKSGTGLKRLTRNPGQDRFPAWSPDGKRIVFTSDRDDDGEIYVMDATTGKVQPSLTENSWEDYDPTWSPDNRWIAFVSERDGNAEIYRMRTSGTGEQRLTENPAVDLVPNYWQKSSR